MNRKSFVNSNLSSKIFKKLYEVLRGEEHSKVDFSKVRERGIK